VEVDDAEEGLTHLLRRDVLPEASAVVPKVLRTSWLNTGEDPQSPSIIATDRLQSSSRLTRASGSFSSMERLRSSKLLETRCIDPQADQVATVHLYDIRSGEAGRAR